jgi:hypothetical protein
MGHLRRKILAGTLLVGLVVVAASCGSQSAPPGRYLASLADLTLVKGRPGHVWVDIYAKQDLRLYIVTQRPLTSYGLAKVAASDGSATPVEPVSLQGGPDTQPSGLTTYELVTTKPVTPGTYRIELAGDARVEDLKVDNPGAE